MPDPPKKRADAQRNIEALLHAAMTVFARDGVDAGARQIAEEAGVGVGTLYRHFPQRSDLIIAVFRREVDACADAAVALAADHPPGEALARWIQRFVDLISTKRGLGAALHSGDASYAPLPDYFNDRLRPTMRMLLTAAQATGEVRSGLDPDDLLTAVASLCGPRPGTDPEHPRRMVALLIDGLRSGPTPPASMPAA